MQRPRSRASGIVLWPLLLAVCGIGARPASAGISPGLDASNTNATAAARFESQSTFGVPTPHPGGGLDVSVGATASDSQDTGPNYDGDFTYEAYFLSTGFVDFGFASASYEGMAESTPESVESIPPGFPIGNLETSFIDGAMDLRFTDVGVVTGATPGAPVALTLHVGVQSAPVMVGGHPNYERWSKASMYVRVIDIDGSFIGVERTANGSEVQTVVLDTFVGSHLTIEGRFRAEAKGTAGAGGAGGFVPQFLAQVDNAVGGFWMEPPAGTGFDADSTADYTVPLPEPGQPLLTLVGGLGWIATARRRALAQLPRRLG
jgi:hypothetical protein